MDQVPLDIQIDVSGTIFIPGMYRNLHDMSPRTLSTNHTTLDCVKQPFLSEAGGQKCGRRRRRKSHTFSPSSILLDKPRIWSSEYIGMYANYYDGGGSLKLEISGANAVNSIITHNKHTHSFMFSTISAFSDGETLLALFNSYKLRRDHTVSYAWLEQRNFLSVFNYINVTSEITFRPMVNAAQRIQVQTHVIK